MNRYDHWFRALPVFQQMNAAWKVRYAQAALRQHREYGWGPEDDEAIVRQFDLSGMAEFWDVALSEPLACSSFVNVLSDQFLVVLGDGIDLTQAQRDNVRLTAQHYVNGVAANLRRALRDARKLNLEWIFDLPSETTHADAAPVFRDVLIYSAVIGPPRIGRALVAPPDSPADGIDLEKLQVRPRAAVEWLLAMPKRRHLVPPSLSKVMGVLGSPPVPVAVVSAPKAIHSAVPRSRGRTPKQGPRVEAEMRAFLAEGGNLDGMIEKRMETKFKASRDTCRAARLKVLSANVAIRKPSI